MPRIYRVMMVDGDKPGIGTSARTLGVRVPPGEIVDITVSADGTVEPGRGGMSVAPHWRQLPKLRIPSRLKHVFPGARGSNRDACWRMGEGEFVEGAISDALVLRRDSPIHGVVEPVARMALDDYQEALWRTRDLWVIDES